MRALYSLSFLLMCSVLALGCAPTRRGGSRLTDAGTSGDSHVATGDDASTTTNFDDGGTTTLPDFGVPDFGVPDFGIPDLGIPDFGTTGTDASTGGFDSSACDPSFYAELPVSQSVTDSSGQPIGPVCSYPTLLTVQSCLMGTDTTAILTCQGNAIAADTMPAVSAMDSAGDSLSVDCTTCINNDFNYCLRLAGAGREAGDLLCCQAQFCSTASDSTCVHTNCAGPISALQTAMRTNTSAALCLNDANSAYSECFASAP